MGMDVVSLSPFIAAEVRGLDVGADLDGATLRRLHDVWCENLVLLFRRQTLSDEQLVRFSRHFGELDRTPIVEAANPQSSGHVPNLPEVTVVSNVFEDGVAIGVLGADEAKWHTDMSYTRIRRRPVFSTRWRCRLAAATRASSICTKHMKRFRQACGTRSSASR